jgi:hypothetical protein
MRRSEPKVLVLQVSVPVDDSAAPLPRRPIFGRSAGERLKFGRRIGVETGHWKIRMGPRGGAEAAAVPKQGEPSPPVSRLALARGECWHAACSPQS